MAEKYVMALDQGTTSSRAIIFNKKGQIVAKSQNEFTQYYPQNGWVEHDANEILFSMISAMMGCIRNTDIKPEQIAGIGITNQRETTVIWDKETGAPIYNAIVWQCRRTAKEIEKLSPEVKEKIRAKTGLVPDPYFSASKMAWILKNVPEAKALAKKHQLCLGTMDSFIAYKLTGKFVTDTSNASRTMLFNINTMDYDDELLDLWGISRECLPKVVSSAEVIGECKEFNGAPLCSIIGDQQGSLVGHGAVDAGRSKITYGTGGFLLVNTGNKVQLENNKLLATVAYTVNGKTAYALEGSIFSACSAINWAGHNVKLFDKVDETEKMALSVPDNGGVYFVPAFTGLGSPFWNVNARACFVGITFGVTKNHMVRAVLESLGYGANAIIKEMEKTGIKLKSINVDGGGSKNRFILQFLSDISGKQVHKTESTECSVLGAIYLAEVALGFIKFDEIKNLAKQVESFKPEISERQREKLFTEWEYAAKNSTWVQE